MVLVAGDNHCYTHSDFRCMNMLRHPVWIFDIDNMSMHWANSSALLVWNATTLEELLQRDFISDMSEATVSYTNDLKANQIHRNEYKTDKWTFYPKGGARTLDVTFSAIRIHDGRIAVLAEAEIMDDKSTIADNTTRSLEILKHLPVAVSEFSMEGKLIYQNPKACKWFGLLSSDAPEHDNANEDSTKDDERFERNALLNRFVDTELGRAAIAKAQEGDIFCAEALQYTQLSNTNVVDASRWYNVVLRRARDPVTSDFVILYIARDISDIIQARKEKVQAAMKSEFLDVMAHEIRTPLHQIVGFVDLLEDSNLDDEQMSAVQQIKSSCLLLIAIINDLLDCSKLEYGQLQIENLAFALDSLVNGCIASIGPQAQSKGLVVKCNIDPICATDVVSDRIFTTAGSITVNLTPSTTPESCDAPIDVDNTDIQWIRFEVIDTGIGIDPSEQIVVFERYRQANASVARNFGGTGLGLPICKGLVELLGGTIGLESNVGKGTRFYFDIPMQRAPKVSRGSSHTRRLSIGHQTPSDINSIQNDPTSSLNILVVEDNKINQKVVKAMLQRMGHTVTLAEHGEVALTKISQQQFNVILMDIQMPVMDGVECTKYIRNVLHISKEQLPIIGLTAGYQPSDRDYYEKDVGMNGCLGKPLPMEKLRQSIAMYQKLV